LRGEALFYLGRNTTSTNGRIMHGALGEVMGPAIEREETHLTIQLRTGTDHVSIELLSRTPPPPLPGGYVLGDRIFCTGRYRVQSNVVDVFEHGTPGEVVGPGVQDGAVILQ
jgi:hypothetical protein